MQVGGGARCSELLLLENGSETASDAACRKHRSWISASRALGADVQDYHCDASDARE